MVENRLPVVICDFHQHVLPYIHRFIARKKLPFTGLKMIHFDSHPDMSVPWQMLAEDCFNKEKLYETLEIADWLLPLAYEGHLQYLVWVKPPWANQIRDICECFAVGEETAALRLGVSCKEDYFLEDCLYCPIEDLQKNKFLYFLAETLSSLAHRLNTMNAESVAEVSPSHLSGSEKTESSGKHDFADQHDVACLPSDAKRLRFSTPDDCNLQTSLSRNSAPCSGNPCRYLKSLEHDELGSFRTGDWEMSKVFPFVPAVGEKFVLDIDLDFFSVKNPFTEDYTEAEYKRLRDIYALTFPVDRADQNQLRLAVRSAQTRIQLLRDTAKNFHAIDPSSDVHDEELYEVIAAVQARKGVRLDDEDLELLHNAGISAEQPHHVSSTREIDDLIMDMATFLKVLPHPTLVTIARSSTDEYCPSNQVEEIQEKVLATLRSLYGDIEVTREY